MTKTPMDQWGCQGITILWEILVMLFSRELLRDLVNLNGVPLLQGSLVTMGNNDIFEGALARFGKISMEFLHWGGLHGNYCEILENLNGVPSLGGFTWELLQDLGKSQWSSFIWGVYKGIIQLSQRCK